MMEPILSGAIKANDHLPWTEANVARTLAGIEALEFEDPKGNSEIEQKNCIPIVSR